eukprot:SAG31_NODE_807_length_11929_cov_4.015638_3_plen_397_part_00
MNQPAGSSQHSAAEPAPVGVARGFCDARFSGVRAAFERCFGKLGETGASVAVYHKGELVCNLWGGAATDDGTLWEEETLVMPYSVSKPFAALCCLLLVDRGLLDVERLVVDYWPEFGRAGKDGCTVRQLLEHSAGIPFPPDACSLSMLYDTERLAAEIAAQAPMFKPGTVVAEHALLYGNLCGALVQRITGRSLGVFFREEVAEPFGLDLHFGVPTARLSSCAALSAWPPATRKFLRELTPLAEAGLFQPDVLCDDQVVNSVAWRQAELPAVNMHGTARSIARVYAILANGGELNGSRLLKASTVALLRSPGPLLKDEVFGFESRWSLGFQHHPAECAANPAASTFGLGGIGGSSAYGSFELNLGFAYVTRQMGSWDRAELIEDAVKECIGQHFAL